MGAELFLTTVAMPVVAFGEQLDATEQHMVLRVRIERLRVDVLTEIAESCMPLKEIDIDSEYSPDEVRTYLMGALAVLEDDCRDTTIIDFEGRKWLFTGGMSSGDDPTDSFQLVRALAIARITDRALYRRELHLPVSPSGKEA